MTRKWYIASPQAVEEADLLPQVHFLGKAEQIGAFLGIPVLVDKSLAGSQVILISQTTDGERVFTVIKIPVEGHGRNE